MNNRRVARELLAIARDLTAATKDLGEIRAIMPEMKKKQEEHSRRQEEQRRELNRMYHEAVKDVDSKTKELSAAIVKALVDYFNKNSMGVRSADIGDNLVEVFIGSDDGVDRVDSKVSTHISMTTGRDLFSYMLRNEVMDDERGNLADKGTIPKLLQVVRKADRKGFWSEGRI